METTSLSVIDDTNTITSLSIPQNQKDLAKKIDQIVKEVSNLPFNTNPFELAIIQSNAISTIEILFTDEAFEVIFKLQNKKLGFLTSSKEGFTKPIVKACVIEALLIGVRVIGNEFNIIEGKCYITKEGFSYLLRTIPELTYDIIQYPPKTIEGVGKQITNKIKYTYKGKTTEREISFIVKENSGMGTDGLNGKAERKVKKWLYNEITGKEVGDGDAAIDIEHEDLNKKRNVEKPKVENKEEVKLSENKNNKVEEAQIINEEPTKCSEKQQIQFDKHISRSISKVDLVKRAKDAYTNCKLELNSFDLTEYNKLMLTLQ